MYHYRDGGLAANDQLVRKEELDADIRTQFAWRREEPGSPVPGFAGESAGRYGLTHHNIHWGFRATYAPDTRLRYEIAWSLMDLKVGFDVWEIADYLEIELNGPLFQKEPLMETGLGERYMQDLLRKALEVYPIFRAAFAEIGAQYDLRNPVKTFKEEHRIPRISWTNVFGPPYVEKYGRDFLLDAPGHRAEELEDGSILYQVTERFFLTEEDIERGPTVEEVERHFKQHPAIKRIIYQPVLLKDFVPRRKERPARETRKTTVDVVRWAEDCVETFGDRFGVVLDYGPESLAKVDEAISEYFEAGEEPLPTTVLVLGAYLGEVVRLNLGGEWRLAEDPLESAVSLAGAELYPFRRVAKRFMEGPSSSLAAWYEAVARPASGE